MDLDGWLAFLRDEYEARNRAGSQPGNIWLQGILGKLAAACTPEVSSPLRCLTESEEQMKRLLQEACVIHLLIAEHGAAATKNVSEEVL